MNRALLAALLALGLAACAGAPKKPQAAAPAAAKPAQAAASPGGAKVSPYAPAQEDPSKRGNYVAGGLYAPGVADTTPDYVPDVDRIPEPEVVDEPRSRYGNRSPYQVLGKSYHVRDTAHGYVERGLASYYGQKFHGRRTSNLEVYDMYAFSAAHKTLPLPSFARVTNLDNGKSVVVRVNDRGPFHAGRVIDLSYAAAVKLGITRRGTGNVEVRALKPGDPDVPVLARAQPPAPPAVGATNAGSGLDTLVAAVSPIATARAGEPAPRTAAPTDYRFDMRRDGKPMTADEFDAWMKARQVRVATGKPAPRAATTQAVAPPPPPPAQAAAAVARAALIGDAVTLQIASFTARANADRALSMLRAAGIDDARVLDADANGQKVWRLRVGPLQAAAAPELAARVVGLGFGTPQRVRE